MYKIIFGTKKKDAPISELSISEVTRENEKEVKHFISENNDYWKLNDLYWTVIEYV